MDEVIKLEELCSVCHKKKATLLCDYIVHEWRFAGHPPFKYTEDVYTGEIYKELSDIPISGVQTCDRKICSDCATKFNGLDLCPKCVKQAINQLVIKG